MKDQLAFFIDGQWVEPSRPNPVDVINPATEKVLARISLGGREDVDRAVAAAKTAFRRYSRTTLAERRDLLQRILDVYQRRLPQIAAAISAEMGAPFWFARDAQAATESPI